MNTQPRSEKHEEGRNTLPDELKPVFDTFVEDYKFASQIRYDRRFVSYLVLADLIKAGWRRSATAIDEKPVE